MIHRIGSFFLVVALATLVHAVASAQETPEFKAPPLLPKAVDGFTQTKEAKEYHSFCPRVWINDDEIKFTQMEERLLCGDHDDDEIGLPWRDIPPNQAAYFLRGFLQARGHHSPRFVQDGERLFVDVGPVSRLSSFKVAGGPHTWDPPKHRLIDETLLTPSLLNDLQAWTISQIKDEGYACATAESRADPARGDVLVFLSPGDFKYIAAIEDTGDRGLRKGVLNRYNAFTFGDPYKERLIRLTRRRTTNDDVVQALVLHERCEPGPHLTIERDVVLGAARSLRIAGGASSEEGAKGRVIVRQSRIGPSASSAELRILASYLRQLVNHQQIRGRFRWFYNDSNERAFLEPSITFDHTAEEDYETQDFEAKLMPTLNRETTDGSWEMRVGPGYLDSFQARGVGPSRASLGYIEANVHWLEHDFEWFNTSPRTGEVIDATAMFTTQNWGSDFTMQKFQMTGQKLWSVGRFDPPLLILGIRFSASSVFSMQENITNDIPIKFLTFLGGDADLRGFERQSLPRDGKGALSGASTSFEARLHKVLFRRIDTFGFLDVGALGGAGMKLERPIFMSPGVGLRYETRVGVFRTYAAQRFAIAEIPGDVPYGRQWRFGFTFGEEF